MKKKVKRIGIYIMLLICTSNFLRHLFTNARDTVFITASVIGLYIYSGDLVEDKKHDGK